MLIINNEDYKNGNNGVRNWPKLYSLRTKKAFQICIRIPTTLGHAFPANTSCTLLCTGTLASFNFRSEMVKTWLSLCMPQRHTGEWRYSSPHSLLWHWLELYGQLHAPADLPCKKNCQYPLNWGLAGPQDQCEYFGKEKNLLFPTKINLQFLSSSAYNLFTIPTKLSWLISTIKRNFFIHAIRQYSGSRGRAPLIPNLDTRERCVIKIISQMLYPQKEHPKPLNRRLGGSQSRSGRFGEKKNLLPLWEFEAQTVQSVA